MEIINYEFNFHTYDNSTVWMCLNRSVNNKINRLNETCFRIICSDKTSSFEE